MNGTIILIGMPGCGKTTLARASAASLGLPWYDCDALIEEKAGMSISEVFATWGESAFRTMETAALIALCKRERCVIATGGGCVTREENYPILHESGRVLWLLRDIDKLPAEGRPISLKRDISAIYAEREPLYRRFADACIDNNGTIEETIQRIQNAII
ncbi:MAG: shikimate kinase [Oscillospiraceae bacterium]|nr:shikimate kinase [Oscillospiraceae bacterium]